MNKSAAQGSIFTHESLNQSSILIAATGQVERAITHHVAHDLNNALGAIEVFSEMLMEDVTDLKVRGQLDKMRRAALMARSHVDVLRQAVPKHLAGRGQTSLKTALSLVQKMIGDQTDRFVVADFDDVMMVGEVGVFTYILYQLAAHVLGSSIEIVYFEVIPAKTPGDLVVFRLKTSETVNPLTWEKPFFEGILDVFGARADPHVSEPSTYGFSLHWPCVAV